MKLTQTQVPTIENHLARRLELKAQIEALEAEKKAEDAAIQAELLEQGVDTLIVGDHKVSLIRIEGRQNIDRMKLLELGVTTDVIKKATTQANGYERLDVRKAGKAK